MSELEFREIFEVLALKIDGYAFANATGWWVNTIQVGRRKLRMRKAIQRREDEQHAQAISRQRVCHIHSLRHLQNRSEARTNK
ncbi:MAG: hypothetical protein CMJ64_03055 [Planctomycetaceae bacterium]|jgi:hypothetical protein|nr:hypothetical protein [Planctomycetaceae bacterium]